jgi:transposase InsO family protein
MPIQRSKGCVFDTASSIFHWGLPEEIVSDNAKSFTSLLYRLLMGVLRVKVGYITPGHPWENPFAESFIGTLRAYFYPHMQRQKTVAGIQRVYTGTNQITVMVYTRQF